MGGFGIAEIGLIVIVAILVYGKDLPQVARKVARFYAQAKGYMTNVKDEINKHIPEEDLDLRKQVSDVVDEAEREIEEERKVDNSRVNEEPFDPSRPPPDPDEDKDEDDEPTSAELPTPPGSPDGTAPSDEDPKPSE